MTERKAHLNILIQMYTMSVSKDIYRRTEGTLKEHGLSKIHIPYLMMLHEYRGMTLMEMSEAMDVDRANTTRAISSLRDMGYVRDDRESESSRKYHVFITERGREVAESLKAATDAAFEEYRVDIDDDELEMFERTFEKIFKAVCRRTQSSQELPKGMHDSIEGRLTPSRGDPDT